MQMRLYKIVAVPTLKLVLDLLKLLHNYAIIYKTYLYNLTYSQSLTGKSIFLSVDIWNIAYLFFVFMCLSLNGSLKNYM